MWQKSLISSLHRFRRPFQSKQIIWHSSAHTTKPSNSNKAKPYWRAWSALDTKLNTNVAAVIAVHAGSKSWMGKCLMIIFRSLLSRPEKFCRAAAGLLKTSSLIVGSELKSRIYLMSIYLKTNKNAVRTLWLKSFISCPPFRRHFVWSSLFTFTNRQNSTAERFVDNLCRCQVERTKCSYQA